MMISIIGCGWFGLQLAKSLISEGHDVKGSTTSTDKLPILRKERIKPYRISLPNTDQSSIDSSFFICDVLVIAIPPKVRSNPNSPYIPIILFLIESIKASDVRNVIYISSTGVYTDASKHVDETTQPDPDSISGKVLFHAESLFRSENSFRTTIVRFGGLIGPGRDPANFFSGKRDVPNGQAPVNLIHLDDCCGICLAILKQDAFGYVINAVSPEHPKKMEFYKQVCIRAGVPEPEFRDELLSWKIVDSVNIQSLLPYSFSRSINS